MILPIGNERKDEFEAEIRYGEKRRGVKMSERTKKYDDELPRRLYSFFLSYQDAGAPSISKFARSIGVTCADIESYRTHREFERAYNECNEIRRDYLIDNALSKRFDASLTKFILCAEFGMGEKKENDCDKNLDVTIEVLSDKENED
jgi:hypothetical protein